MKSFILGLILLSSTLAHASDLQCKAEVYRHDPSQLPIPGAYERVLEFSASLVLSGQDAKMKTASYATQWENLVFSSRHSKEVFRIGSKTPFELFTLNIEDIERHQSVGTGVQTADGEHRAVGTLSYQRQFESKDYEINLLCQLKP